MFSVIMTFVCRALLSLVADGCVVLHASFEPHCGCYPHHGLCSQGLCGICPGPALVSLARGESWILIFMGVYVAFAITVSPLEKRLFSALNTK
jgi:hypothetical protein